jgi:hypothetical protein
MTRAGSAISQWPHSGSSLGSLLIASFYRTTVGYDGGMRTTVGVIAILVAAALFAALGTTIAAWIRDKGLEQFSREIGNQPRVYIYLCQLIVAIVFAGVGARLLRPPA